jgi:hypothetical protein
MKTLTVKEKYSKHWLKIAVISAILAVLLFGAYLITADVLIEGYLRLAAFCFFALSLLSFFKVKDGQIKIDLEIDEKGGLQIDYFVRNKKIAHDAFDLNRFDTIEIHEMPNRSLYNDFVTGDRAVRFKQKESSGWLYLTEVHGRVIPLDSKNATQVSEFINRYLNPKLSLKQ